MTSSAPPLAQRERHLRLWKVVAVLALLAGWAYVFVVGDGGWLELRGQRQRLTELESEVARLQALNDSLTQVLWRLENDPAYVEKVAREEHGMVRPGERLYRVQPAANDE